MGEKINRRTNDQRAADRARIAELYLAGRPQHEIAEEMELDDSTISRDLDAVRKQWKQRAIADAGEVIGNELDRIGRVEREAWVQWERSKQEFKSSKTKVRAKFPAEVVATKTERVGDPRFLQVIMSCVELRAKLLGLIVTKHKHTGTGKDGAIPIELVNADEMKPWFMAMGQWEKERRGRNSNRRAD